MYSDDDANSDASSVCSERSYGSRNGGVPHYLRQTEDVAEVLNHCASSNWSERKEGLLGLQNLLKSQRTLRWAGGPGSLRRGPVLHREGLARMHGHLWAGPREARLLPAGPHAAP